MSENVYENGSVTGDHVDKMFGELESGIGILRVHYEPARLAMRHPLIVAGAGFGVGMLAACLISQRLRHGKHPAREKEKPKESFVRFEAMAPRTMPGVLRWALRILPPLVGLLKARAKRRAAGTDNY